VIHEVLDRYLDHLSSGDADGAIAVAAAALEAGTPVEVVVEDLICAAQAEVGRRWERNEWSVAQEHAATAISETVMDRVIAPSPEAQPSSSGRLVAVCVEGEWHTLALKAISAIVRRAQWEVTFLGPSVPVGQLGRYLHDVGPDGLLVSCSVSLHLPGARRVIAATRNSGTPVLAGGRGFGPDGRWAIAVGADRWAADGAAAVEQLAAWTRFTTPAPPLTHRSHAEHLEVERRIDELTDRAFDALAQSFPPVRDYDDERVERTREDLNFLLRFLSAALLVDDADVLSSYITWLHTVLTSRGLPPAVVPVTLDSAISAVDGLPRAVGMLMAARDEVTQ
jgi:methanogenic corrinoid protein MtbC1